MNEDNSHCVGFPHTFSASAMFLYLFVYESQVFVTWSLLGRERTLGMKPWECNTLGMSVMWRPFNSSGVVSLRIIDVISRCHYKFTR